MTTLLEIFSRQFELMKKFERIERENKLLEVPGQVEDLDSPYGQAKMRRIAWAITEEVGEVLDLAWLGSVDRNEEIADVFHFLVELIIVSGIQLPATTLEDSFTSAYKSKAPEAQWLSFLVQLARTIHHLRNRPHKTVTQRKATNVASFTSALISTFDTFISAAKSEGLTAETLAAIYLRKADINEERVK